PGMAWNNAMQISATLKKKAERSRLVAIDVESGKIAWEAGDSGSSESQGPHGPKELLDHAFLGPPLPLAGKLYVLAEKAKALKLMCLDAAKGELIWSQTLANVQNELLAEVQRRVQAVHLAYGEGILVCPTNAGAILGVDLLSHSLVWAYPYREKSPDQPANPAFPMRGRRFAIQQMGGGMDGLPKTTDYWKYSSPIIQDGKVVFTAWDGSSIHCLNLHDG